MPDIDNIEGTLYMGSAPEPGLNYKGMGFNAIVLCAREVQPTADLLSGVTVIRAPMDDDFQMTSEGFKQNWKIALEAANIVAVRVAEGQRVLVTCAAGKNRSGTVCALVLWLLTGKPGWYCVEKVRQRRRTTFVLSNPIYARALTSLPAKKLDKRQIVQG